MALVLFDYDGVLADTLDDLIRFGQLACDALGVAHSVSKHDLANLEVMSFPTFGRACGVPEHLNAEFVSICLAHFAQKTSPPDIFPGLGGILERLSARHKIAVVTTNSSQNVRSFLIKHGLDGFVHAVYGMDSPGSKAQKISLAQTQLLPESPQGPAFMIGDSLSDILAAKEAGVVSIAVTWGHQGVSVLRRGEPDFIISSPHEILDMIEK